MRTLYSNKMMTTSSPTVTTFVCHGCTSWDPTVGCRKFKFFKDCERNQAKIQAKRMRAARARKGSM